MPEGMGYLVAGFTVLTNFAYLVWSDFDEHEPDQISSVSSPVNTPPDQPATATTMTSNFTGIATAVAACTGLILLVLLCYPFNTFRSFTQLLKKLFTYGVWSCYHISDADTFIVSGNLLLSWISAMCGYLLKMTTQFALWPYKRMGMVHNKFFTCFEAIIAPAVVGVLNDQQQRQAITRDEVDALLCGSIRIMSDSVHKNNMRKAKLINGQDQWIRLLNSKVEALDKDNKWLKERLVRSEEGYKKLREDHDALSVRLKGIQSAVSRGQAHIEKLEARTVSLTARITSAENTVESPRQRKRGERLMRS